MKTCFPPRRRSPAVRQQRQPSAAAFFILLQLSGLCLPAQTHKVGSGSRLPQAPLVEQQQPQQQQQWTETFSQAGSQDEGQPAERRRLATVTAGPQVGSQACPGHLKDGHHAVLSLCESRGCFPTHDLNLLFSPLLCYHQLHSPAQCGHALEGGKGWSAEISICMSRWTFRFKRWRAILAYSAGKQQGRVGLALCALQAQMMACDTASSNFIIFITGKQERGQPVSEFEPLGALSQAEVTA